MSVRGRVLPLVKAHAYGNDFLLVTNAAVTASDNLSEITRRACDRHRGVGADGLMVVEDTPTGARTRLFNADGGEVENCGNGARCFARYVLDKGLTTSRTIRVGTAAGVIVPRVRDDGLVSVSMGVPEFEPARIPFLAPRREPSYRLRVGSHERTIFALSMGNPHAVQVVTDVDAAPVAEEAPLIERHDRFPQRVNAGYVQLLDAHTIKLRVYERGAGETLACGTGACAAVVAGIQVGLARSPVEVRTRGGRLLVEWDGVGRLSLLGPVEAASPA